MTENAVNPSLSKDGSGIQLDPTMTREEQQARMAKHVEELQKQNPESDFKADSQWWAPSINFGVGLQESLDQETNNKFKACIAKMFERKCAPYAVAEARGEASTILAGHPDMLERVNALIFQNEKSLASVHEYSTSEAAAGREVFGSCATTQKK